MFGFFRSFDSHSTRICEWKTQFLSSFCWGTKKFNTAPSVCFDIKCGRVHAVFARVTELRGEKKKKQWWNTYPSWRWRGYDSSIRCASLLHFYTDRWHCLKVAPFRTLKCWQFWNISLQENNKFSNTISILSDWFYFIENLYIVQNYERTFNNCF